MTAQILPLPSIRAPTQPVAHFLRIGDTGHRLLADLHAEGRLPARQVVVDASRFRYQKELVDAFRETGAEIVLDTKAAELAARAKFQGYARDAPWAASGGDGLLGPEHFNRDAPSDVIGQIARFAVERNVHVVLAPCHFLSEGPKSEWFRVNREACIDLRVALDREGGSRIGIDYTLIASHMMLFDEGLRGEFIAGLEGLPFDNLWIRASGFGADGAPATTQRYISAVSGFHNLGKPIVADYLGGLVGLASIAFGAVCGFAHGVGERERFDARSWHKAPPRRQNDEGGGRQVRIAIPGLDRSATIEELKLLAKAKGGRGLVVCGNRECCRHGLEDMVENPRRHAAYQRMAQIRDMERTPDSNRAQHFLDGELTRADRLARRVKELKIGEENMTNRLVRLRVTLEHLHETRGNDSPRSPAAVQRISLAAGHRWGEA